MGKVVSLNKDEKVQGVTPEISPEEIDEVTKEVLGDQEEGDIEDAYVPRDPYTPVLQEVKKNDLFNKFLEVSKNVESSSDDVAGYSVLYKTKDDFNLVSVYPLEVNTIIMGYHLRFITNEEYEILKVISKAINERIKIHEQESKDSDYVQLED